MLNYDVLIKEARTQKFQKLKSKKGTINSIVCSFDEVNGHVAYKDGEIVGPCHNQNICELNPVYSRYKMNLEKEREKLREWGELKVMDQTGEMVCCVKHNCKNHGLRDVCSHGVS